MNLIPKIFDASKIVSAQSVRTGGVSPEPFSSLNLGLSVNDDKKNVLRNRELFFGSLGIPTDRVSRSHQVHGDKILQVTGPVTTEGYDALITNVKGNYLAVSVADCTPILIHDEKQNAIAAIHAGWKGTAAEIVSKTLRQMQEKFLTEGKDCKAFIGACISYSNFEVGEEVAQCFDAEFKRFDAVKQKWFVDLKSVNRQQLLDFGVLAESIEVSEMCTVANNALFFSHRKEKGNTGRMMAVIGMK